LRDLVSPTQGIGARSGYFGFFSPKILVVLAALIAVAAKIYCAATTFGSCDVTIYARFGQIIDAIGIDYLYTTDRHFNHTPVTGQFVGLLYHFASYLSFTEAGNIPRSFPFLLRLPSIIADLLAVLILLKFRQKTGQPPVWSLVLFALSPAAFMVSGFHGNVDSVMICVLLIAVYFCVEENAWLSGIFLAFACSVKVIPLLLTPVFFFFWLHRGQKRALQFALAFVVSCLAGWSDALIGSPAYFLKNVLGYSSYPGGWGIPYWCIFFLDTFHVDVGPESLTRLLVPLLTALKLIVIASVIALAWWRRKQSGLGFVTTIALSWACFVVFAPGFIPYYLIWMAPFVLLYSPIWYLVLTSATTIYLFAYYNMMSHGMPWDRSDPLVPPMWNDLGNIPWFVTLAMGVTALVFSRRSVLSPPSPQKRSLANWRRPPAEPDRVAARRNSC
jgi:hypothetical protein